MLTKNEFLWVCYASEYCDTHGEMPTQKEMMTALLLKNSYVLGAIIDSLIQKNIIKQFADQSSRNIFFVHNRHRTK